MSLVAYVDGRYVPHARACVHVEDRGYQFSDSVYEVIAVHNGRLIDEADHIERLGRSLAALRIGWPVRPRALGVKLGEMVRRNKITRRGIVYLQISRGVAPRNHLFPPACPPVLVMTARTLPPFDYDTARRGVRVVATQDLRWGRRDIKSTSLLANVLARQHAWEQGAFEAWLVDSDGKVTEGTASNAWIVTGDGALMTHNADRTILSGITRGAVARIAAEHGLVLRERAFTLEQAKSATEAFLTSTTSLVKPVIRIDDTVIGNGSIGPLTQQLLDFYIRHLDEQAGPAQAESPR